MFASRVLAMLTNWESLIRLAAPYFVILERSEGPLHRLYHWKSFKVFSRCTRLEMPVRGIETMSGLGVLHFVQDDRGWGVP